jgi:hypothetical protein
MQAEAPDELQPERLSPLAVTRPLAIKRLTGSA